MLEDHLADIVELDKTINKLLSESESNAKDLDVEIEDLAEFQAELKSILNRVDAVLSKKEIQIPASQTE